MYFAFQGNLTIIIPNTFVNKSKNSHRSRNYSNL